MPSFKGYLYTPEQLQRQMSYIEQNVFLFNTTLRENITLGKEFTEEQMQKVLRGSALDQKMRILWGIACWRTPI